MTGAIRPGTLVWLALAILLVGWVVVTTIAGPRRLPGIAQVVRWFLQCWLGRFIVLAAWAGAGWHVFCQRP